MGFTEAKIGKGSSNVAYGIWFTHTGWIVYFCRMKYLSLILLLFSGIELYGQAPPPPPPPPPDVHHVPDSGKSTEEEVLNFSEQMPEFRGGEKAFQKYLVKTIHYPDSAIKYGREGTVYVYFEVSSDGSVQNARCVKGVPGAPELSEEAVRVISIMPDWEPGTMQGKAVRVSMTVPIKFVLTD